MYGPVLSAFIPLEYIYTYTIPIQFTHNTHARNTFHKIGCAACKWEKTSLKSVCVCGREFYERIPGVPFEEDSVQPPFSPGCSFLLHENNRKWIFESIVKLNFLQSFSCAKWATIQIGCYRTFQNLRNIILGFRRTIGESQPLQQISTSLEYMKIHETRVVLDKSGPVQLGHPLYTITTERTFQWFFHQRLKHCVRLDKIVNENSPSIRSQAQRSMEI